MPVKKFTSQRQCTGLGIHAWETDHHAKRQMPRYEETVEIVYLRCTMCPRTRWTEMGEYGQWLGNHHYGPSGYRVNPNGVRISRAVYRLLWVGRQVPLDMNENGEGK